MTKLKTFFKRPWARSLLLPILLFMGYFALGICCALFIPSAIVSSLVLDVIASLLLGYWCLSYRKTRTIETHKLKFSIFGWGAFLMIFFCAYMFSEYVGNYIAAVAPTAGATEIYKEMSEMEVWFYVIMAISVGPLAEELLYRFGIFRLCREKFSFPVAYLISGGLFALSHGTLMHLPVAMMISLFISIVYEYTGLFRYCVIFHILFNACAVIYVFSAGWSIYVAVAGYVITFIGLCFMYKYRVLLFDKIFKVGGMQQFENYLDEKRKHFGDDGYGNSDDENE